MVRAKPLDTIARDAPSSEGGSMVMAKHPNSKRVLVAHNVIRGHWGGMARMMESVHNTLELFGWTIDYFTADNMPSACGPRLRRYSFPWHARRYAREAFRRGEPYDVINIHEPVGAAVVFQQSGLGRPAIVAMSHGVEQRYWELRLGENIPSPEPPTWKTRVLFPLTSLWQSQLTLRRADHVLCLNEEDRNYLSARFRIDPDRITRVFPGTGPEFSRVAAKRCYDRVKNRVLFSGTWIERKGIRQIVEAFSLLADRHPLLRLGILGAGVPASRVIADFPAHLHSRIAVLPPLSHADCAEVLLDYDVFLLPSFFEGTPLALIEAMCTGIPVITTKTCGMMDVVEDGQNGLLIAPGNSEHIISSVELLMTDSSLRRRLGTRASNDASLKYTWRAAAELVNNVYSDLLRS
jgi:glycosyltransferase involved in cell wall biosynthesis